MKDKAHNKNKIPAGNTVNVYTCSKGHKVVTKDVDEGTTPVSLDCDCGETAYSCFYECDQTLEHSHVWFRPVKTTKYNKDHLNSGGLVLLPIAEYNVRKRFDELRAKRRKNKSKFITKPKNQDVSTPPMIVGKQHMEQVDAMVEQQVKSDESKKKCGRKKKGE